MTSPTRSLVLLAIFGSALCLAVTAAAERVVRQSEYGKVVGYKDTPKLPWTDNKYHVHDPDRPLPKHVAVGKDDPQDATGSPPSDAIVLFDGSNLDQFKPASWKIKEGYVEAGHGSLYTKQPFGDCQLHLEWMVPTTPAKNMMNRGNSGVILMGLYEIQIFDSHPMHAEQIYPDGQAASIYGQTPPLVNACRKPGQWQSFDIVFKAPVFEGDTLAEPARVTVFHNGVLVHHDREIMGPMAHRRIAPYRPHAAKLPLTVQGHGSPLGFRNIWIRPLDL